MGLLDCLSSVMATFAVNYIANSGTIVLIGQSVPQRRCFATVGSVPLPVRLLIRRILLQAIPISMLFSRMFLGATYNSAQYAGALTVCMGIIVVLLPEMFGGSTSSGDDTHNQMAWALVLMLSCIPSVLSSVYKEKALQVCAPPFLYCNFEVLVSPVVRGIILFYEHRSLLLLKRGKT